MAQYSSIDLNNPQMMESATTIIPISSMIPIIDADKEVTTDQITSLESATTEYKTIAKPLSVVYVKPPPKIAPKPPNHMQNVRLNKSQTVFLQNSATPLKGGNIAYITMLKPVNKTEITHISQDAIQVSSPQTFVLNHSQNRVAVTHTTNSVIPKFTLMPITLPNSTQNVQPTQQNLINLTITDGQIHSTENNGGAIRIMQTNENNLQPSLLCDEVLTAEDATTKEVTITTEPDFAQAQPVPPPDLSNPNLTCPKPIPKKPSEKEKSPAKVQKTEHRRKSTVLIRQDFSENDDPMDLILEDVVDNDDKEEYEPDEIRTEFADFNMNMNEDYDIIKGLKWDEGVGSLPGTNLKFQLNEFGILEYLTNAEYRKIYTKKLQRERLQQLTTSLQEGGEEMRCLECGCYGMPADFVSPKYCSYDCQKSGDKKSTLLRQLATANFLTGVPQTLADINSNRQNNNGTSNNHFNIQQHKLKLDTTNLLLTNNNSLANSKIDYRRKRKMIFISAADNNSDVNKAGSVNGTDGSRSDDDADNGKDSFQYPWACTKKGQKCFSWSKYLSHTNSKAVPVRFFKDAFPYQRNGFRLSMKLEGIDPQHPGTFCVLSVAEVRGYRIRVHLDGYSEQYDYWLNADSLVAFPVGYCEKHGYRLRPPPPYTEETFTWAAYLKDSRCTAAYKQIMANRPEFLPTNFRTGQKLEAVDRKNSNLVCVASVANIMDNRILVHFDSWDDIYDYWADPSSPYIHPVGWSDQNGHSLTPPNDYPDPETFCWDDYLRDTKTQAAPVRAFKQRPACGFRRGMKLECVDKRVPQLIRVATVDEIDEHRIKIRFDGWPAKYSYWVDDDSPDVHPVGWCSKTGHPIEPPLTPDDVYDFLECPTVGCRGVGSTLGPAHTAHTSPSHCPYADEHLNALDQWRTLPDRLLSPNRKPERAIVVSRGPQLAHAHKEPKRMGRPPKKQHPLTPSYITPKSEPASAEGAETTAPHNPKKPRKHANPKIDYLRDVHNVLLEIEQSKEDEKLFKRHTKKLDNLIQLRCRLHPSKWTFTDVMNFVSGIPTCSNKRQEFAKHNIDGKCFLMLTQTDLMELLDFKVGPAVKLYNCILLLRQRYPNCT